MNKQSAIYLTILLLIALGLRLGWTMSRDAGDEAVFKSLPDQGEYLQLGRNLLHRHELMMRDSRLDADVRAFRAPGYPAFIAACGGNVSMVRVAQSLLETATVLAIFLLARRWLSIRFSLLAAAIVAVNPFLIFFSSLILSETLFIFLLAWGMLLLARRVTWGGMLLLAGSVMVRPGAIALPILLALASSIERRSFIPMIVGTAALLVVLFPWAWRNERDLGRWIWTSTNSGFTMYDGFNSNATGGSDQRFVADLRDELTKRDEVQRSDYLSHLAWQAIADDPARAAILALKKIARAWTPVPLSKEYGGNVTIVIVALTYTIPLFVLTLLGLMRGTLPALVKLLLMSPAVYFTIACAISVGSLRYRIPADVSMAIVAASALPGRMTFQSDPGVRCHAL